MGAQAQSYSLHSCSLDCYLVLAEAAMTHGGGGGGGFSCGGHSGGHTSYTSSHHSSSSAHHHSSYNHHHHHKHDHHHKARDWGISNGFWQYSSWAAPNGTSQYSSPTPHTRLSSDDCGCFKYLKALWLGLCAGRRVRKESL